MRSRCTSALLALSMGALSISPLRADVQAPAPSVAGSAPLTTPEAIEQRLQGKTLFLRGFYLDNHLEFDSNGKVEGNPARGSFTLSGLEVKKVRFTKHSVEIEAERIGLHFFGALPYETDATPYETIKIASKPVDISIERLVIEPEKKKKKKKKNKDKDKEKEQAKAGSGGKAVMAAGPGGEQAGEAEGAGEAENAARPGPGTGSPAAALADAGAPAAHHDPKESYIQLSSALDKIFASGLDQSVIQTLPEYWQIYFATRAGKLRAATDAAALHPGGGVKAPHLLNVIDPDSNDFAQKSGIAGMILLQTVVSPTGKPGQVNIIRPIGFGLDEKAVEAVEHSQFRPGTQDGQAVPVLVNLEVTFRIYSDRTRPRPGAAPAETAPGTTTPVSPAAAPSPHVPATATTVAAATLKQ